MRIRTIKPEFWTDKRVASWDCFTRLCFIGLWSAADDHGRGSAEPARLAAELFPYDLSRDPRDTLAKVSVALATLSGQARITLYEVSGEQFFEVSNWALHQRVDRPGKSRIPAYKPEFATPSRHPRDIPEESSRLEQGTGSVEQGTGSVEVSPVGDAPKGSRFVPPSLEEVKLAMAKAGLPEDQAQAFINYHAARGWMLGKSKMKSWPHAVGTWAQNYRTGFNRNGNHHRTVAEERNSFIGQLGCEDDSADVPFV